MAVFTTPFTTPANYTYDNTKIDVTGGLAQLKETSLWNGLQVYYRAEEILWNNTLDEVIDSSDNNIHATSYGATTIPVGKIGRGGSFDGVNDYVVSTNNIPASLQGNSDFTVSFWVYVPTGATMTGGAYRYFFSFGSPTLNSLMQITNYNVTPNRIYIGCYGLGGLYTSSSFSYNTWVNIIWSRTGGGRVRDGNEVYFNNVLQSLIVSGGTSNPNTLAGPFQIQRGVPSLDERYIQCFTDEVCVWSKRLTSDERDDVYNLGDGQIFKKYVNDKPTVYKTVGDNNIIGAWNNFSVTEGTVEGSLAYQLSEDGITWKYWNGGAWVASVGEQYNIESVVNANIPAFPTVQNKIYVRTWLISDGFQNVQVDEIQITYTSNFDPSVDAGTNKTTKDNTIISPFSDCSFSDSDGTIDIARYKVDGEVDIWTEISQGAFGSLLEAVQAFTYHYNNIGILTTRLQVEDDIGATADDSLTVTVSKYTKTIIIKSSVSGEHLAGVQFDPGDGTGFTTQNSPFDYDWEFGTFDVSIFRDVFNQVNIPISVSDESDLTFLIAPVEILNIAQASVGVIVDTDTLCISAWLSQNGIIVTTPTSCAVQLIDCADGSAIFSDSSTAHTDGHFRFSASPSGLPQEGVYYLTLSIVNNGITVESTYPVGTMINRNLMDENLSNHKDADTVGEGINDLLDMVFGDIDLDSDDNSQTFYRRNGTVLKIYNLVKTLRTLPSYIGRTLRS